MKTIFFLTGEHIELATEEVIALTGSRKCFLADRALITESGEDLSDRLAFTHSTHEFLFKCSIENLEEYINNFDFLSKYEENFCVRVTNSSDKHLPEKMVADLVWVRLQNQLVNSVNKEEQNEQEENVNQTNELSQNEPEPTVNLTNAKSIFTFFITSKGVFVGKKMKDIDKSFFDRWPHKRPEFHPTSITSKLARCCVNLSGIKDGVLYDPFCGIGAILIEAGMMKLACLGSDLSEEKLKMAKTNLDHYDVRCTLTKQDALNLPAAKYDCIVTDPPYGKNEKVSIPLENFYSKFIMSAYNSLKKGGVMVMLSPKSVNFEKINFGFDIISSVEWFVHGSLTRRILILKKE